MMNMLYAAVKRCTSLEAANHDESVARKRDPYDFVGPLTLPVICWVYTFV